VERLRFVTRLKLLRFSLDEIRELITLLDTAATDKVSGYARDRLDWFVSIAEERCEDLRVQLATAEEIVDELRDAVRSKPRRRR
jgi:DNA-binding transcriptional MerR regulator